MFLWCLFEKMHLFITFCIERIVFSWVTESLVFSELMSNHSFQATVVFKLLPEFEKLFAHAPLIDWFGQSFDSILTWLSYFCF